MDDILAHMQSYLNRTEPPLTYEEFSRRSEQWIGQPKDTITVSDLERGIAMLSKSHIPPVPEPTEYEKAHIL